MNTGKSEELTIRESGPDDSAEIESLYPEAFPDEDLLPLVRELLVNPEIALSLVGVIDSRIVGNAIFTHCGVTGSRDSVALLAPVAVSPGWQRRGVGSAMVRAGLRRMEETGVRRVFVLGDPAYYGRLGFLPESLVEAPYPLPSEWEGAWQSQSLGEDRSPCSGRLSVPALWRKRALWAP